MMRSESVLENQAAAQRKKGELLEALEMYYKVLYLGEGLEALDEEEDK